MSGAIYIEPPISAFGNSHCIHNIVCLCRVIAAMHRAISRALATICVLAQGKLDHVHDFCAKPSNRFGLAEPSKHLETPRVVLAVHVGDSTFFRRGMIDSRTPLAFTQVRRDLTCMMTRISSKGRLVLPAELRQRDHIVAGQTFEIERLDAGDYRLVRQLPPANQGLVDRLRACPEKGYFVPIDSASTDTL